MKNTDYDALCRQLTALTEGERSVMPNLANAAALLWGGLDNINWAGFYTAEDGYLLLGPFQGKPACMRIQEGRGVCGAAAREQRTQRVDDVSLFPGHIACDAASRSEIVVPLVSGDRTIAVMDIDSAEKARFSPEDQAGLERFAAILLGACDWQRG